MSNDLLVRNIKEVESILKNINWSFYPKPPVYDNRLQPFNCRKYHWYPATFIPEIPYTLIEILSKPGAKVFDPFLGIGTTFFQALLLNRIPFGSDICSVSIEFSKSLLILFNPDVDIKKIQLRIDSLCESFNPDMDYYLILERKSKNVFLKELKSWYTSKNFNVICFLILKQIKEKDIHISAAFKIVISSILSTSSNQNRGWGCIADNMLPKAYQVKEKDVLKMFKNALSRFLTDIYKEKENISIEFKETFNKIIKNETIIHNSIIDSEGLFERIPKNSIDLIVTSPPYPNMADYSTSQRLSQYYLGNNIENDKKKEIGARYRRSRASSLDDYLNDMNLANRNISDVLKVGGLVCFVMPSFDSDNERNSLRKTIVQKVISKLDDYGLTKEIELERAIPSVRRSHNAKWASLEKEIIHIYRKI